ncbi:MAG: DMT family transporter [Pseudomonadota bacterium]
MSDGNPRPARLAFFYLLLAVSFWAGNTVIGKSIVDTIPPFSLSFWRWALACVVLAPFAIPIVVREREFYREHWKLITLLAFFSITIYNTFQYWSMQWITATKVGIISASLPVFIFMLSWLMGVEKIGSKKVAGLFFSLSGVALVIFAAGGLQSGVLSALSPGDGLILTSIVVFAVYSVYLKRLPNTFSVSGFLFVNIVLGLIGILPFYLFDVMTGKSDWPLSTQTVSVLAYVAIFPSIVSGILWLKGVRLGGPALGGIAYNFIPVIASLLAVTFLGEEFTVIHLLGIVLVLFGVNFERITTWFTRSAQAPQ